ncbi:MAG: hypothetical protein LBV79_09825 [Candidatus Adiutrix sp.]|jgi:hypothetical protein|nr:hypothetical protein [Candidatus Adiutrix sp.]
MKALVVLAAILSLTPAFEMQAYEVLDEQALTECYAADKIERLKAQQKYVDEAIKPELAALFQELQGMRNTQAFRELGFSGNNRPAAEWKARVEQCRARLAADENVPVQVKALPGALLSLGLAWVRHDDSDSMVQWHLEQVNSGLDWYFGTVCLDE